MPRSPEVSNALAANARAHQRNLGPDAIADARRDLATAKIADYITRVVDAAPPLSTEQRDRLALLLRGAG